MSDDRSRPNLREAFYNWSYSDKPLHEKIRLTAKNQWKKLRTMRDCCGHIDEPGC